MKMPSENFAMGGFLFSQITVGLLGNSSILLYYIILIASGKHLMPRDVIIQHMTFANCLSIMSRGVPRAMSDCGFENFLDDVGCKLTVYTYRIARGMSLYAMCLLSCFQAITINSSNSRCMKLKHRAPKYVGPFCSLSWLLHLLLNILIPVRISGPSYRKNETYQMAYGYCSLFSPYNVATVLYLSLLCYCDGLGLGLMACSSVSMVSLLYRHKKQVRHIHGAQRSLKVSPEDRATQTILILLCTFVISYSFSSIVVVFRTYSKYPMVWGVSICTYLEICFPVFCPFVLITNMKPSSRAFLSCFVNCRVHKCRTSDISLF
ncbi:vomeronasal type-1 receptor 4-like [Acomys russatus]|uniref:vomeronasal type-1 receptor 4-like n=1 Tax=Acomys russatus TaxID=60746 RepID=UPI0021E25486|nr:vomeronasal type-1 receptor 4-like [Acomys russatus]